MADSSGMLLLANGDDAYVWFSVGVIINNEPAPEQ